MPENTVSVTRPGKWGNPFRVGGNFMVGDPNMKTIFRMSWCEAIEPEAGFTKIADAAMAVDFYKRLMASGYRKDLSDLRGKNLACWCKIGDPCHADVLIELANSEEVKK